MIEIAEPLAYRSGISYRLERNQMGEMEILAIQYPPSSSRPSGLRVRSGMLSEFRDLIEQMQRPDSSASESLNALVGPDSGSLDDLRSRTDIAILFLFDDLLEDSRIHRSGDCLKGLDDPIAIGILSDTFPLEDARFTPSSPDQELLSKIADQLCGIEKLRDFARRRFDHLAPISMTGIGFAIWKRLAICAYPREFSGGLRAIDLGDNRYLENLFHPISCREGRLAIPKSQMVFNMDSMRECSLRIPREILPGPDIDEMLEECSDHLRISEGWISFTLEGLSALRSGLYEALRTVSKLG